MGIRHGLEVGANIAQIYCMLHDSIKALEADGFLWGFSYCTTANIDVSYALQWLFALPLEIISGALTIQYWNASLNPAIFVTIFLFTIVTINMFGIKGYGEAEFIFSTVKVTAIVGFM
jgi:amino acid permease